MTTMSLRQWALRNGIPPTSAYRHARNGNREALKLPVTAVLRQNPTGGYLVDLNPTSQAHPDLNSELLASVDPHAFATWLHQHGYVLLTTDEARQLGVEREDTGRQRQRTSHSDEQPAEETRPPEP